MARRYDRSVTAGSVCHGTTYLPTAMIQTNPATNADLESPLNDFAHCHEGILSHQFFQRVVFDHHVEEEKDLFPAVIAAARQGDEHDSVQRMIDALTHEHRVVEALWRDIEPGLGKLAKGHIVVVDATSVDNLIDIYNRHARFEEQQFLPAAKAILARKDPQRAELGLSLHMRHAVRAARRGFQGS